MTARYVHRAQPLPRARTCASSIPSPQPDGVASGSSGTACEVPETPGAALRSVLSAIDAALSDGKAGVCIDLALPSLQPMAPTFEPEAMALFALNVADALAARAVARTQLVPEAPAPGPVRLVCSPPAVLAALERRLSARVSERANTPRAAVAQASDDEALPAAGCEVIASIVGDDLIPLGGVSDTDGTLVFVCPCAIDADEWSPIWPIREALRAARKGRLSPSGKRLARATVVLNSRFYAEPAELAGFELVYLCKPVEALDASRRAGALPASTPAGNGLDAEAFGGAREPSAESRAQRGGAIMLPGAGWGTAASPPSQAVNVELALVRAYPGQWRLLQRVRAAASGLGSDGAATTEWIEIESRPVRPDGKALKLVQVQIAYGRQRKVQLAAQARFEALAAAQQRGQTPDDPAISPSA